MGKFSLAGSGVPRPISYAFAALASVAVFSAPAAHAAKSDGCEGGGFTISGLLNGMNVTPGSGTVVIPASNIGPSFQILGRHIEFTVVAPTFAVENYTFTGATNPENITNGKRITAFQSKTPDHRGLLLTSGITVSNAEGDLVLQRTGAGLKMKIQAKDCAQGGIFQMEPERSDKSATRVTHVLGASVFYFDNPSFRAREGDLVPYKDIMIAVPTRINIGSDLARDFVTRDSAQVAERIDDPACRNSVVNRDGSREDVLHCGRTSSWMVASGGRMGFVTGEDAIEVAPPPTNCVRKCQAQNRVRGRSVKLPPPFPVPDASRLKPDFPPSASAS
jgi:hypothetical protein